MLLSHYFFNKFNDDNLFFRETNESNLLLKEKAESLQNKLQRADQRITELTRVEIENEVCNQAREVHPIQMISLMSSASYLLFKLINNQIGITNCWFFVKGKSEQTEKCSKNKK